MALNIIHTADWHIGQTFYEYNREDEHLAFMAWLIELLKKERTDVLLIAGDVFDVSNPSSSAQRMFYKFLRDVNMICPQTKIVVIAGNHDSAARLEAANPITEVMNVTVVGSIKRNEDKSIDFSSLVVPLKGENGETEAWCMAIPYLRQGDYPVGDDGQDDYTAGVARMYKAAFEYASKQARSGEAIIAMGHLYAAGAELSENDRAERVLRGGLESLSDDAFDSGIAYTALGHIHKAQRVGGRDNVRYSGSLLPMSFSEKNYNHQVVKLIIDECELKNIEQIQIPLYCSVVSVPKEPLTIEDVLQELSSLPDKQKGDNIGKYPYMEVRVLVDGPNPSMRARIEEALTDKAVRLACITPVSAKRSKESTDEKMHYEEFKQLDPLEMLNRIYEKRYDAPMPESLSKLFNQVVRDIQP